MELLNTLGVNVGMIIAQLLNFGILMAVLTYFVYKPVLRLIDDRRERVRKSMEDAKKIEQQVQDMEKHRRDRIAEMDGEAKEFLVKAKEQAEQSKKEILAGAQREVDLLLQKGREQLEQEKTKLLSSVQKVVTNISIGLAEKILEREFSEQDQDKLLKSLEKDLPALLK